MNACFQIDLKASNRNTEDGRGTQGLDFSVGRCARRMILAVRKMDKNYFFLVFLGVWVRLQIAMEIV